eukprot:5569455-Prorocentrum_lima.AAC.1
MSGSQRDQPHAGGSPLMGPSGSSCAWPRTSPPRWPASAYWLAASSHTVHHRRSGMHTQHT